MAEHISVLLNECIDGLNIKEDGIYVDGTVGLGGHSYEIAKRLTTGKLICFDRDETAIKRSKERLAEFSEKITFIQDNFCNVIADLNELGIDKVDGMMFDLGVSSPQLDEAERGFSYMHDAPLDMRMDQSNTLSAWFVVNKWPREKIERILKEYGEEKNFRIITNSIIKAREVKNINTTGELVEVVLKALPASARREKQHPAKRLFQAIRIAVNDELGSLQEMVDTAPDKLNVGGRLVIISFHSLEDRIVKKAIQKRENGCTCPREAPICTCGFKQTLKSVNRKPITASREELENNPRSRSAKLRVAEKV